MKFTARQAANAILAILCAIILFHLIVLSGVIPYQMVWGGRLQSHSDMIRFEAISIAANLLMVFFAAAAAGHIAQRLPRMVVAIAIGLMTLLFLLNTLGNLASNNNTERLIFTPLTIILSLLCVRVLRGLLKKEIGPAARTL